MSLDTLFINDFRCLAEVDEPLHPSANLIIGDNGSGKTSFLEAIYFLGRGRSFRSTRTRGLVRDGQPHFVLRAGLSGKPGLIGVQGGGDGLKLRIDGHNAQGLEHLASALPVQVIEPGIHRLVESGPSQRRAFLDWGVFHVKQPFLEEWRRCQRALKQRNAVLRQGGSRREAAMWEDALVAAATAVHELRQTYLDELMPGINNVTELLLDEPVAVNYHRGWSEELTLEQALEESWSRDARVGHTHVGPQRADLRLRFANRGARDRVSRGQQKLLAAALILAQVGMLAQGTGPGAVLLLDDPAAELDKRSLERLFAVAGDLGAQQFITGLDQALLPDLDAVSLFHVKQGALQKMV